MSVTFTEISIEPLYFNLISFNWVAKFQFSFKIHHFLTLTCRLQTYENCSIDSHTKIDLLHNPVAACQLTTAPRQKSAIESRPFNLLIL